jgi:putative acetyltransferase
MCAVRLASAEEKHLRDFTTLTIRGLHTDDTESLFALWNTPETILDSTELPYVAEDAFREQVIGARANAHILVAEAGLSSGRKRLVGLAWLAVLPRPRRRHAAQLSLVVQPDYRDTQVETALLAAVLDLADRWLGLRRVEVNVYTRCEAAIALYQRHGFEIEATLRRYAFRDGVYSDACIMARLRGRGGDTAGQGSET